MIAFKKLEYLFRLPVNPPFYALKALSNLTPRSPKRWAFGSHMKGFNGNTKYFFIYMTEQHPELETAWITTQWEVRDQVRALGLRAYHAWEPEGLRYCLGAGYYLYQRRLSDINFWAAGKTVDVNLWHGVGIKGVGYTSTAPYLSALFKSETALRRLAQPWLYHTPSYFVSTAPLMTDHFQRAFRLDPSTIWECGYSRSDLFYWPDEELERFVEKYEPRAMLEFIEKTKRYDRTYLYMPTYRDNQEDFLALAGIDFARLDAQMREKNQLFVFKLHYWTKYDAKEAAKYDNLVFIDNAWDVYPFLKYIDVLVTDYSSIYFDYLLLDKDVLLFPFDREHFSTVNRDLILDYDEYMPGTRVYTFDDLLRVMDDDGADLSMPKRDELKELFWGDYDGHGSERIAEKIFELRKGR